MNLEEINITLVGAMGAAGGFLLLAWGFMRWLDARFAKLQADLQKQSDALKDLELEVAKTYATKTTVFGEIKALSDKIDKLGDEIRQSWKSIIGHIEERRSGPRD